MRDKFKTIWAQMRASEFGPEPLVIELYKDDIIVQTVSSHDDASMRCSGQDGLFCEGSGKTLNEALDSFSINLDTALKDHD